MRDRWTQMPALLRRVAEVGSVEGDSDLVRLRKRILNLAAFLIAVAAPLWTTLYLLLGLRVSAAIPFTYAVVTFVLLWLCTRYPLYRWFRMVEMTMMILLPFVLQFSLGGFANGSVVALWALTVPLGAVFFMGARRAVPWFAAYVALVIASGLVDPAISDGAPSIPDAVVVGSFVLNLLAVSATVFLLVQYSVRAREIEHARSERLLLNVLPESVARRLKQTDGVIADAYPEATVLFADIVGFTPLSQELDPGELVALLDRVFTSWDELAAEHGLEKIKTVGDEYMVVGGVPDPRPDHAEAVAAMALDMSARLEAASSGRAVPLRVRIGIDSGPLIAGVIGRSKFIYDVWGDTVNTASRMESSGEPGRIQVTDRTRERLGGSYQLSDRGETEIKGKGPMKTHFLESALTPQAVDGHQSGADA